MNTKRPSPSEYDGRYARYMELVPESDLLAALARQREETAAFFTGIGEQSAEKRYAPEKWSIREVLGHIMDTDRIFGFRILSIGRGDTIALQRADENLFVKHAGFASLRLAEILEEYALVRRSNEALLRHLPDEAWDRAGTVNGLRITVRALAYLMAGHERHHIAVVKERYLQGA